jgi:hypothetical protein
MRFFSQGICREDSGEEWQGFLQILLLASDAVKFDTVAIDIAVS